MIPAKVPAKDIAPASPLFTFLNLNNENEFLERALPISELTVSKVDVAIITTNEKIKYSEFPERKIKKETKTGKIPLGITLYKPRIPDLDSAIFFSNL